MNYWVSLFVAPSFLGLFCSFFHCHDVEKDSHRRPFLRHHRHFFFSSCSSQRIKRCFMALEGVVIWSEEAEFGPRMRKYLWGTRSFEPFWPHLHKRKKVWKPKTFSPISSVLSAFFKKKNPESGEAELPDFVRLSRTIFAPFPPLQSVLL